MFGRAYILPLAAAFAVFSAVEASAAQPLVAPKITDAKLGAIRYGGESVAYWIGKMKPGDQSRAATLQRDLNRLRQRLQSSTGVDQQQAKALADYLNAIDKAIAEKAKPVASKRATPDPKTPSVQAAPVDPATEVLIKPTENAAVYSADASKFVNSIQAKYGNGGTLELPDLRLVTRDRKVTVEEVDKVLADWKVYQDELKKDLPKLKQVVDQTGQGKYWLKWLGGEQIERFKQSEVRIFQSAVDSIVTRAAEDAKNRSSLDLEKHAFQFRGDMATKTVKRFEEAVVVAKQAARLEEIFGLKGRWSSQVDELKRYTAIYRDRVAELDSGKSTKLPKDINDSKLRKIAEQVLRVKKYGVGKWQRLIVNSKLVPRDRIEHKAFNGSIETIVRKWEEFQVTTVEQDKNGKYYLYFNTIAKFSRAPRTTPIDTWILSKRFKGNAVAAENVK